MDCESCDVVSGRSEVSVVRGRPTARMRRRAAVAAMLGNLVETSDYILYAALTVFTAPLFFPSENPATSVIASLVVLGAGYLARPLGGIYFGRMGDRRGRRTTLIATILLMGVASGLLGVVPTYAAIGVAAPLLVLGLRLVQGFAAGGEVIGGSTYSTESSTPGRRALFSAMSPLGAVLGLAFAPTLVGLSTLVLGPAQMALWGWRIPFLVAFVVTLVSLLFRLRIEDSPEFLALVKDDGLAVAPLREALRSHKTGILIVIGLSLATLFIGNAFNVYMPVYLITVVGLSPSVVPWLVATVLLLSSPFVLVGGLLADRFGQVRVMATAVSIVAVVCYPLMAVMSGGSSILVVGAAYLVMLILLGGLYAPAFQGFADVFPARIRFTAAALGYNVGTMIGGGFGPYFTAQLVATTGDNRSPAYLVIGAALIGIVSIIGVARRRVGALSIR